MEKWDGGVPGVVTDYAETFRLRDLETTVYASLRFNIRGINMKLLRFLVTSLKFATSTYPEKYSNLTFITILKYVLRLKLNFLYYMDQNFNFFL